MTQFTFNFLGPFQVEVGGTLISNFHSDKARALLAYLAIDPQIHARTELATLLWPGVDDEYARTNLRTTLYRLRQTLAQAAPDVGDRLLTVTRNTVQFVGEERMVDVLHFQHLNSQEPTAPAIAPLAAAAALYRGELLLGLQVTDAAPFEEWLLLRRELLHQQAVLTLHALCTAYEMAGDDAQAYAVSGRLLILDPYREESYRQRMRLLARVGQPHQALQQFEQLRRILRQEMAIDPSPETVTLAKQIAAGDFAQRTKGQVQQTPIPSPTLNSVSSRPAERTPQPDMPSTVAHHGAVAPVGLYDVPDPGPFFGRVHEQQQLTQWLLHDRCRVVAILGIGGMGKTSLAAHWVRASVDNRGDIPVAVVLWRSLLNAPPLTELLPPLLQTLSDQQLTAMPANLDEQLRLFLTYLRAKRVLLVLDNLESILEPEQAGAYRVGYESYGQLIQQMATLDHQSHLLLTSRERPRGYARLERDSYPVHALQLSGLDRAAGYSLLAQRGIAAQGDAESQLIKRYSGNPLALKLVADTVDEIFEGNIGEFLAGESMVFGDVRDLLDQHFARLTPLEQEVLFWLAIVREPIDPPALRAHLLQAPANRNLLEALNSLQRRSLIERQADGFALQNVITEYLTDRLVGRALAELTEGKLDLLHRHPLLMAEAKEYVRESQVRLLVQPVAQQIVSHLSIGEIKLRCQQLLDRLRSQGPRRPSYAGGTILNLLLYLHAVVWRTMPTPYSLASCDFSKLALRQAHLRGAMLPAINFAESDLAHSTFTQAFGLATALAVSRDGQLLAAGGSGNEINIWQLSDYQPLRTLKGNLYNVSAVAFSPDGNLVACVTMHGAVYTWDVQSGRQLWSTEVSKAALYCVTFSPDGRALVASGHGPYIHFWESRHATWYRRLYSEPDTGAFVVAFHPHRPLLAVTSSSGNIFLVDCARIDTLMSDADEATYVDGTAIEGWAMQRLRPQNASDYTQITAFAFSPDGQLFACGGNDGLIELWDVQRLEHLRTLRGHQAELKRLEFSPDSKTLVSGGFDQTLRLWDVAHGVCDALVPCEGLLWSAAFTPDGQRLISCGEQGLIRIWNVLPTRQLESVKIMQGHMQVMPAAAFHPSGNLLAIGDSLGIIRLWDLTQSPPRIRYTVQGQDWVETLAFSPDGRYFASAGGYQEHTIQLWDTNNRHCFALLTGHKEQVLHLIFSPDGALLASGAQDGAICLWDVRNPQNAQLHHIFPGLGQRVCGLTFNCSSTRVATSSADNTCTFRFWDNATGEQLFSLTRRAPADIFQFSPQADTVACWAGSEGAIRVVDTATLPDETEVMVLEGHYSTLKSVAFSPTGDRLVSSSLDQTVRLWDLKDGRQLFVLEEHEASVTLVRFSPNGRQFLSSSLDGTIRLWDAETGHCVHIFHTVGPYEGMNITGVTGISKAQRAALKALGAVEQ